VGDLADRDRATVLQRLLEGRAQLGGLIGEREVRERRPDVVLQ
jgi:hypothetical protein